VKVKQTEKSTKKSANLLDSDDDEAEETLDVAALYQSMLKLMQPGETVQRAIKRLGQGKAGASRGSAPRFRRSAAAMREQRVKLAEHGDNSEVAMETNAVQVSEPTGKEDLLALIGFADKLLSFNGEMEIYQDTYEKLNLKVKNLTASASTAAAKVAAVDRGLDMFADDTVTTSAPVSGSSSHKNHESSNSGL